MKVKQALTAIVAVLGAVVMSVVTLVLPATASAYSGFECRNGYQPAGRFVGGGVQDVCALPSVVDYRGFVNPVSARLPEPPPEWRLPDYAQLDAGLPPCFSYDPRTFNGPCAPAWVRLGY